MVMVIGVPVSSRRGFVTAMAWRGVVVERARREGAFLWRGRRLELGDFAAECHEGARKSRNSGCWAWVLVVVKLRDETAGAHAR